MLLTSSYAEVAADVTAVVYLQCENRGIDGLYGEFTVAGSEPAASVDGVIVKVGETITGAQLVAIAATGAVYGRAFSASSGNPVYARAI